MLLLPLMRCLSALKYSESLIVPCVEPCYEDNDGLLARWEPLLSNVVIDANLTHNIGN